VLPGESVDTVDMLLNSVKLIDKNVFQQLRCKTFLFRRRNVPTNIQVVHVTRLSPFLKHANQSLSRALIIGQIWVSDTVSVSTDNHQHGSVKDLPVIIIITTFTL